MPRYKIECINAASRKHEVRYCEALDSGQAKRAAEKQGFQVIRIYESRCTSSEKSIPSQVAKNSGVNDKSDSTANYSSPQWFWPVVTGCVIAVAGMICVVAWLLLRPLSPISNKNIVENTIAIPSTSKQDTASPTVVDEGLSNVEQADVSLSQPTAAQSLEDVVAIAQRAVAAIKCPMGIGSGFVVESNLLVTNSHVISGAFTEEIDVIFPSHVEQVESIRRIVWVDEKRDLAIIELAAPREALQISTDYGFKPGTEIIVIGNPSISEEIVLKNAVTSGITSTIATLDNVDFYQLSVSINPGNSGGPVLTRSGHVVAVATMKATQQEGLAFGIPSSDVLDAIASVSDLSESDLNHTNLMHNATSLYNRCRLLGEVYLLSMDSYVTVMDGSIDAGLSSNWGIEKIRGSVESLVSSTDGRLLSSAVEDTLRVIQKEHGMQDEAKRDLLGLWTVVKEARSYVQSPRGNFNTYSAKARDLRDQFNRHLDRLKILLDIHESPDDE